MATIVMKLNTRSDYLSQKCEKKANSRERKNNECFGGPQDDVTCSTRDIAFSLHRRETTPTVRYNTLVSVVQQTYFLGVR